MLNLEDESTNGFIKLSFLLGVENKQLCNIALILEYTINEVKRHNENIDFWS